MERVLDIFKNINKVPRGSGNMEGISKFTMAFAESIGLRAVRDSFNNVVVYKPASKGYESLPPVILQGHLDMVCQKKPEMEFDFTKSSIDFTIENGWVKAQGTTLGADNGIGAAIMLRILEDNTLCHPPIEAVFTTDEEIGMIGAAGLDMSLLKGKMLINLDSEDEDLTVSCAGGVDFTASIPVDREVKSGTEISVTISGLMGGHSGVEIHKGGKNADVLMGKALSKLNKTSLFYIKDISGGDKANAIANRCTATLLCKDENAQQHINEILTDIRNNIVNIEPDFSYEACLLGESDASVFSAKSTERVVDFLAATPQGVQKMSEEIEGLVETSLNLGVLYTQENDVTVQYALRSSKEAELMALSDKMKSYGKKYGAQVKTGGFYPPWEYNANSILRPLFIKTYEKITGKSLNVTAIHAGLECAVFASKIKGLDCVATGPVIKGAHTTEESLSLSSLEIIYKVILDVLKNIK